MQMDILEERVREILQASDVDLDKSLSLIGIDSLNVVEVIIACQEIYDDIQDFDDIHIDETTTLRELNAQLCGTSDEGGQNAAPDAQKAS